MLVSFDEYLMEADFGCVFGCEKVWGKWQVIWWVVGGKWMRINVKIIEWIVFVNSCL